MIVGTARENSSSPTLSRSLDPSTLLWLMCSLPLSRILPCFRTRSNTVSSWSDPVGLKPGQSAGPHSCLQAGALDLAPPGQRPRPPRSDQMDHPAICAVRLAVHQPRSTSSSTAADTWDLRNPRNSVTSRAVSYRGVIGQEQDHIHLPHGEARPGQKVRELPVIIPSELLDHPQQTGTVNFMHRSPSVRFRTVLVRTFSA